MKQRGHIHLNTDEPLDLSLTLQSGQTFRWEFYEGFWTGVIHKTQLRLKQNGEVVEYETYGDSIEQSTIQEYFGLNQSISKIYESLSQDKEMKPLLTKYRGLRILKQDPWETTASFILSSCTNIPRIEKMINNLVQEFGIQFQGDEERVTYQFPQALQIAESNVKELRKLGLGYRADYLHTSAKKILNENLDFSLLENQSYTSILEKLEEFPGIGKKIADCIALFGLRKFEAFPIDTHIFGTLVKRYRKEFSLSKNPTLTPRLYDRLRSKCQERFGAYAGYAQQYLYVDSRFSKRKSNLAEDSCI